MVEARNHFRVDYTSLFMYMNCLSTFQCSRLSPSFYKIMEVG